MHGCGNPIFIVARLNIYCSFLVCQDNPTVVEYKKGKSTKSMNGLLNTLKDQLEVSMIISM